jgi:hypothetical protein
MWLNRFQIEHNIIPFTCNPNYYKLVYWLIQIISAKESIPDRRDILIAHLESVLLDKKPITQEKLKSLFAVYMK